MKPLSLHSGLPAIWIDEPTKDRAELAGYTVVDPPSVVATHLTEIIKRHAHELIGRQETKALVENVRESYPALVDDLIPSILSIGDIQKVLAKLLREKISIRDMVTIFETLADHGNYSKDTDILTEYVRQSLSRQITQQFSQNGDTLRVITVGPALEKKIAESVQSSDQGSYLALDPVATQTIYQKINEQVKKQIQSGNQPIVLASPTIRMYLTTACGTDDAGHTGALLQRAWSRASKFKVSGWSIYEGKTLCCSSTT